MDVARAADPRMVGLRHERDRAPVQMRDLLGAVLVDRVVVRHRHRVGEAEVHLLLTRPGLALRALDRDARAVHAVPDLTQQRLVVGRREHVVVEDVRHRRREVAVVLSVRFLEALLQQVELELGADHRLVAQRRERARPVPSAPAAAKASPATRPPRRRRRARAPSPRATGCGATCPGRDAWRSRRNPAPSSRSSSPESDPSPCRARADSYNPRPLVGDVLVEEVLRVHALAQQPPLHVRERNDDGVDRPALDVAFQFVQRQHRRKTEGAGSTPAPSHSRSILRRWCGHTGPAAPAARDRPLARPRARNRQEPMRPRAPSCSTSPE